MKPIWIVDDDHSIRFVLEKALARNHVTHIYHVYDDAPHAVAAGKGTDAEGWLNEAVAFWEEQVG